MLTKRETCQEYYERRLGEGWKCISHHGPFVVLVSPAGIKDEIDLRNDVETLRPNAIGSETDIDQQEPGTGAHWDKVDETPADDNTTYVRSTSQKITYERDLYNIPDSGVGAGTINKITIRVRCKRSYEAYCKCSLRTHSQTYDGAEQGPIPLEWTNYHEDWVENPNTDAAWTWAEINALEIGVSLRAGSTLSSRFGSCTQVYVEVDYTTTVAPTVTTQAATLIQKTSARGNGNITDDGGASITQHGVCWKAGSDPVNIAGSDGHTTEGAGSEGPFTSDMTGLSSGTVYYYRAYATNSAGTSYGAAQSFKTIAIKAVTGAVVGIGVVGRTTGKGIAGVVSSVGVLIRETKKTIFGVADVLGTVNRSLIYLKALATGTVTAIGVLGRTAKKDISATVSGAGVFDRSISKSIVGAVAGTGSVVRKAGKALSTSVVASATVDRATTYLKLLAVAAVSVVGVLGRTTKKGLSGAVSGIGTLDRFIKKTVIGNVAGTGVVIRGISKALSASVSVLGTVTKTAEVIYEGGVVTTATIGKLVKKTVSAAVAVTATVPRFIYDIDWAMNKTIRQIFAKVRLTLTDPYFSGGVVITSPTGVGRLTHLDQTADNVDTTEYKWFSLHRNVLDGSFHPMPTGKEYSVGWWGTVLSDAVTKEFTPNPVLQIVVAPRTVSELLVVGDERLDEYPTHFWVRLYSAGDFLEKEVHVEGNSDVRWEQAVSPSEIDIVKIILTIEKWSRAGAVSKIIQFFTSIEEMLYSEDGDLISVRVNEEREYAGATIPQGNISSSSIAVRFNNITDLFSPGNWGSRFFGVLKYNRAIKAWLGAKTPVEIDWRPLGLFYSRDWKAPENEIWAEVTGLDTLDRLKGTTFNSSTVYEDKSLQWLAIEIMTDAGLTAVDWRIDVALDSIVVPYAWFDPMSHREALRRVAAAALGQVYCDRNGIIVIEVYSVPATSSFTFNRANFFEIDHPLEWSQMANYVEAQAAPLEKQVEQVICTDIETFTVPGSGTVAKTHFFIASPCVETVIPVLTDADAHITIDSWTPYAWGMLVTYANSDASDEEVRQVDISGKPLTVVGGKVVIAQDATSIADNGKQSLGEPLTSEFWQTEARAQVCADAILATYKDPRRDVTMRARGNIGLLLGDRVVAPDYKEAVTSEFGVMRQDIRWDGGLEVSVEAQRAADAMYFYKKGITAGVTAVGSVLHPIVPPDDFGAGVDVIGALNKKMKKPLAALTTVAGTIAKQASHYYKSLTGNVAIVGTIAKQASNYYKTFSGAVSVIGAVERAWSFIAGSAPITRESELNVDWTALVIENPAMTGLITTIKLWAAGNGSNWKVGTFYNVGGDQFAVRDYEILASISGGYNEFTGLSINAVAGDYIGICSPTSGKIELTGFGSPGYYLGGGDGFASTLTYSHPNGTVSLQALGSGSV